MATLFRREAVAAQSAQWLGGIRLAQPWSLKLVAVIAVLLALGLLSFATWGEYTRKARISGLILPSDGLLAVSAQQPARIVDIKVREGDRVEAGQLLAVLLLSTRSDQGDTAQLVAQSIQARQAALQSERRSQAAQFQQRELALRDRLRSLQLDVVQAEGELSAAQRRVQLAEASLRRDQGLAQQGFLSAAQAQTRQEELLDLQQRERSTQRNLEALRREAQGVLADIRNNRLQSTAEDAQLERAGQSLTQESHELAARSTLVLQAPASGMVGAIPVHPGQSLQAGQTVLHLQPEATDKSETQALQAELYAPSRAAGFVEPGQAVWLRLQAYPYQKFGMLSGQVREVGRTPVMPQDLPGGMAQTLLTAAQAQEPLYRITVALQAQGLQAFGRPQPLKAGMTLDADVIQDRRAIWEWVLEPLLAARRRWQIPT